MAKSTEEDLSQLERDIRQLKIEYEQYFGGGKTRPPADIEWLISLRCKAQFSIRDGQFISLCRT